MADKESKQAEIERMRAEVRKRLEAHAETKKNRKKGFIWSPPQRRRKLRLLIRKKYAEELKRKQPERMRIREQLLGKIRDLTSVDEDTMKCCKEYFDRMYLCDGQKSDSEHGVKKRDWEVLEQSEAQHILDMGTSTTFRVSQLKPEVYKRHTESDLISSLKQLKHFKRNRCTEVLQGTTFSKTSVLSDKGNGFVDTIISCYNGHHNLVMRPDDVWTAIITQFSFYVNKHAEKFRGRFVDFEGKRELVVAISGSLRSASYALLVKLMSKEISRNLVDPDVKSWILPSFSTTTDNDVVTCGAIFMAAMKKYFDYKGVLCCGIPYVTLEGTIADWENLCERLEKLKEYELQEWFDMLKPILDEFVRAKKGIPNATFWNQVCSHHVFGSGATYISGWVTAFCVFDKDGNWDGGMKLENSTSQWPIISTRHIPPGIAEVNIKIDDNGTVYNSCLFAGHLAVDLLDGGKTLQPMTGWVICLKAKPEVIDEIEEIEKTLNSGNLCVDYRPWEMFT